MKTSTIKFLLLTFLMTTIGCDQRENAVISSRGIGTNVTSAKQFNEDLSSLRSLVLCHPKEAKKKGEELRNRICRMESSHDREQVLDAVEREVLSIDIHHLSKADRERSIDAIFSLEMEVLNSLVLTKASSVRQWITRIRALERLKSEIKTADFESSDTSRPEIDRTRSADFARFVNANYISWVRMFESDFVLRERHKLPSCEKQVIQKMLIDFLGRPLEESKSLH